MAKQDHSQKIWMLLLQRCCTGSKFSKATVYLSLARVRYVGRATQDSFAKSELINTRLVSTDALIDVEPLIITFEDIFGDRYKSPFGAAISLLLEKHALTRESVTTHLLQKHE